MTEGKINLENCDFTSKKAPRLNSPRSIEALLQNGLNERDLYNINCIEYTQNVLEQTNVLTGKDIMEIYKFLNTILSSSMECSTQIKEQKQIYETIERDNNTAIDTIIKILKHVKKNSVN